MEKITPYQARKIARDKELHDEFYRLVDEGYMKTMAYKVIMEKYEISSVCGVWNAIKRHQKRKNYGE